MEATIKHIDGLLKIFVNPRTSSERYLLHEFINKELPGYDHHLDYKETKYGLEFNFRVRLSLNNLLKEGFIQNHEIQNTFIQEFQIGYGTWVVMKRFNNLSLYLNSFGGYHYKNQAGEVIKGRFKDLLEMRQYIDENENIWRTWL